MNYKTTKHKSTSKMIVIKMIIEKKKYRKRQRLKVRTKSITKYFVTFYLNNEGKNEASESLNLSLYPKGTTSYQNPENLPWTFSSSHRSVPL